MNTSGKLPSQLYMGVCSIRACKMFNPAKYVIFIRARFHKVNVRSELRSCNSRLQFRINGKMLNDLKVTTCCTLMQNVTYTTVAFRTLIFYGFLRCTALHRCSSFMKGWMTIHWKTVQLPSFKAWELNHRKVYIRYGQPSFFAASTLQPPPGAHFYSSHDFTSLRYP